MKCQKLTNGAIVVVLHFVVNVKSFNKSSSKYNIKLTNIKSNKCLYSTTAKADKSRL
jgi:hypothetical protein